MEGVFSDRDIQQAIKRDHITSTLDSLPHQVQPSSLDLALGKKGWILKGNATPLKDETVEAFLHHFSDGEVSLEHGFIPERNVVYLFELAESFHFPFPIRCNANTKSSNGRIDVRSRAIFSKNPQYDFICTASPGRAYLEFVSNSFRLLLREGDSLNQIRFAQGNPRVTDQELWRMSQTTPLLYNPDGTPISLQEKDLDHGLVFYVDVADQDIIGYCARRTNQVIDLQRKDHPLDEFFEPIPRPKKGILTLEPGVFYLLSTKHRFCIPPSYAAEMMPFDHKAGDLTVHFAGFFDAGFGHPSSNTGTLEVRVHGRPAFIRDGQRIGIIHFEGMLQQPEKPYGMGSHYAEQQGARPAKYFKKS